MTGSFCLPTGIIADVIVREIRQLFKVTRPSIFVGTPSIFESLIPKQLDIYCKCITTHGSHID